MPDILFTIFASIAVLAALTVVLVKNPVYAVLSLIACFIATSLVWLGLDAEFLAWTLILVYVGAVLVLFLFIVMMLDIRFATMRARFSRWLPVGIAITIAFVAMLLAFIAKDKLMLSEDVAVLAYGKDNVRNAELLGNYIFTNYLAQFEVAGVILLVAIIAAIGLIYRGPRNRRQQNVHKQISADPRDRVRLVSGE